LIKTGHSEESLVQKWERVQQALKDAGGTAREAKEHKKVMGCPKWARQGILQKIGFYV